MEKLLQGQSIAYVSDAGYPGISDPGQRLVQAALLEDIQTKLDDAFQTLWSDVREDLWDEQIEDLEDEQSNDIWNHVVENLQINPNISEENP